MGRRPCCSKVGLNRGAWTAQEDKLLSDFIEIHGEGRWRNVPIKAGLKRCGKSCRLRWVNYLKPDIKRGNITNDEEELILRLHKLLGNRWSLIARKLPGRTDNEIKNYWNTSLAKRVHHGDGKSSTKRVIITRKKTEKSRVLKPKHGQTIPIQTPEERTKAAKCSKDFITKAQENQKETVTSNDHFDDPKEQDEMLSSHEQMSSVSNKHADISAEAIVNPSDSMLHYTVEELQLSDILSLQYDSSSYVDYSTFNMINDLDHSSPSYALQNVYDEMFLHDWTANY